MAASYRDAYRSLVNIDEYPEALSLAHEIIRDELTQISPTADVPAGPRAAPPWSHPDAGLTRRQVLHYFTQYAPTALVDGCWLQCGLRVATAHTRAGAALTAMYVHQVRACGADPRRHFVAAYREVWARLGTPNGRRRMRADTTGTNSSAGSRSIASSSRTTLIRPVLWTRWRSRRT